MLQHTRSAKLETLADDLVASFQKEIPVSSGSRATLSHEEIDEAMSRFQAHVRAVCDAGRLGNTARWRLMRALHGHLLAAGYAPNVSRNVVIAAFAQAAAGPFRSLLLAWFVKQLPACGDALSSIPRRVIVDREAWRRAEELQARVARESPPRAGSWVDVAVAWFHLEDHGRARQCFLRALEADPACDAALDGLGTVHKSAGDIEQALVHYLRAIDLAPGNRVAFQNYLFALLCSPGAGEGQILDAHRRFAEVFEAPLARARPPRYPNARDPERKLRIGYISADLRDHVTGRCVAPILANHDVTSYEVYCYYDGRLADAFTRTLQERGAWRDMAQLDDGTLATQIQSDAIDILVDLSGHTPGNRILALARKPAPVQMSYLDYSATTGLASMDYRLTTSACDAEGVADAYYTEKLLRLPGTYWLYNPPEVPDIVRRLERSGNGILLSCVNPLYRVTDAAFVLWAGILRRVPAARLALAGVPADDEVRNRIGRRFESMGVSADRIVLFGNLNYGHYIQLVRATDIALAPFPYNGAMTTLDCLWNGVPVVCLRGGPTFRSSMGRCVLGLVGLDSFAATNPSEYADSVVRLCEDESARRNLRESLRDRVNRSPLRDPSGLVRAIERAYRDAWRGYCASA